MNSCNCLKCCDVKDTYQDRESGQWFEWNGDEWVYPAKNSIRVVSVGEQCNQYDDWTNEPQVILPPPMKKPMAVYLNGQLLREEWDYTVGKKKIFDPETWRTEEKSVINLNISKDSNG